MSVEVVGLGVHPLKSGAIRPVGEARVERAGFASDRRWMVVDGEGSLVSAREEPRLFTITADTPDTDPALTSGLRLRAPGQPDLHLSHRGTTSHPVPVRLHRHDLLGAPMGDDADAWISAATGHPGLRLVACVDPTQRPLNPAFSTESDHTAYADGYPVTLASLRSLAQLNDWIAEGAVERGDEIPEPLPIERFRPNVVIDGDLDAFVEDSWSRIRLGDSMFRVAKPVDRCVMTTIDPTDLSRGKEPIRTLARHRRWDGATWFAIQLIPDSGDGDHVVQVGDAVTAP